MAGIYIHIPFCKKACHYCNFHFSTQTNNIDSFVDALVKEIKLRKDYISQPIQTIYFGGGTPSLLTKSQLSLILNALKSHFTLQESIELTLEANPDDIDEVKLLYWKNMGINRLSIGIQSFQEDALKWMNRAHTIEQSHRSIQLAQNHGFNNISIDLIYGTPHYTNEQLISDLEFIKEYKIPHVSCYALTIEEKTALHSMIQKGTIKNIVNEDQAAHFEIVVDFLTKNGFEHYEISNFAQPGFRSQHNSSYWKGLPYLGLGPSSHSYNGDSRQWNIANNALYIKTLQKNELNFEKEILELPTQYNEYMMISIRCIEGFNLQIIETKFGKAYLEHTIEILKELSNKDYFEIIEQNYSLKKSAKFFADGIASDFFIVGSSPTL